VNEKLGMPPFLQAQVLTIVAFELPPAYGRVFRVKVTAEKSAATGRWSFLTEAQHKSQRDQLAWETRANKAFANQEQAYECAERWFNETAQGVINAS
jgi:hypothetical protein